MSALSPKKRTSVSVIAMSALGQNATWPVFLVKSVLPPMSDIIAGTATGKRSHKRLAETSRRISF